MWCKLPLEISEFSPTPPHSDSVTSGRSPAASDKHSVPLSAAALPTDWGDWDSERRPISTQCLGSGSDSLTKTKAGRHFYGTCFHNLVLLGGYCVCFVVFTCRFLFRCNVILRSVPFWEVASNNIGLEYVQVVQVNVFRPLMLAPLPHTFETERQQRSTEQTLTSSVSEEPQTENVKSGLNENHILPAYVHTLVWNWV